MQEVRQVRGRAGAMFWQLYEDVAHPEGWLEVWSMESWTDHLREVAACRRTTGRCWPVPRCTSTTLGPARRHAIWRWIQRIRSPANPSSKRSSGGRLRWSGLPLAGYRLARAGTGALCR